MATNRRILDTFQTTNLTQKESQPPDANIKMGNSKPAIRGSAATLFSANSGYSRANKFGNIGLLCEYLTVVFLKETPKMNRIVIASLFTGLMAVASFGFGCDQCGCATSCTTMCPKTCCTTTYKTVMCCRKTTRLKKVTCRDACGCCYTKCVPYTTIERYCKKVPVTTCRTVCVPVQTCAPVKSCCLSRAFAAPCATSCAPKRIGLLARIHSHFSCKTCCN